MRIRLKTKCLGDCKVIRRFTLFPMRINESEISWLEWVYIVRKIRHESYYNGSYSKWLSVDKNSDFEMFNYSKDEEVKTSSSAPASTPALKKEAKEKPMTTQQPKAEAKNEKDDFVTFEPDMSYFTPPEEKEADYVPRKPILGKRSPII